MQRIFGRWRYANVTATLALIVLLGGTSYAAVTIKNNSVTSKTVKDRSLLKKDIRPADRVGPRGFKGATGAPGAQGRSAAASAVGPIGATGATGDAGNKGDTGPQGDFGGPVGVAGPAGSGQTQGVTNAGFPVVPYNAVPGDYQNVAVVTLGPGRWYVQARTLSRNTSATAPPDASLLTCELVIGAVNSPAAVIDSLGAGIDNGALSDSEAILAGIGTTAGNPKDDKAILRCANAGSAEGNFTTTTMSAIRVA